MMETYEVVWGTGIADEGFTELVTEQIDAETADEAVQLFPLTPDIPDGVLRVYKTFTNDAGTVQRGTLIRGYEPDEYGYTWIPAMAGPDTAACVITPGEYTGTVTVSDYYDVCLHLQLFGTVSEDDWNKTAQLVELTAITVEPPQNENHEEG